MSKKEKMEPNKFSLIVKNSKIKRIIPIPETKRGLKNSKVGGKETFLMAIDNFTTKFPNEEELLNYIIKNNLVNIPNINYDNLHFEIEYRGKGEFTGNRKVLYNDQKELIDFINNNEIKEFFHHENPYTNDFEQTIVKYWTSGMYQVEYKMFMTDYRNGYFGLDLIDTFNKIKKENLMDKIKNKKSQIIPVKIEKDIVYPLSKRERQKVTAQIELTQNIKFPHSEETPIGEVKVCLENNLIFSEKLYTIFIEENATFEDKLKKIIQEF